MPFLLDALPGRVAILRRMRDTPLPDGEGDRRAYDADEILARMRADREHPWPGRLLARIRHTTGHLVEREPQPLLTEREVRALQLASHGMEERECAELMGTSRYAVKSYWKQARRKLRAKTTTHAVALAIRAGIIV